MQAKIPLFAITLIVLSINATATTIESFNHPPEQIKGGTIPFYAIVTYEGQGGADVHIDIEKPDGSTKTYSFYQTNVQDEYSFNYFDTYQNGTYYFVLSAEKGGDTDIVNGTFKIADFSLSNVDFVKLVDYVSRVAEVDRVKTVDKVDEPSMEVHGTEYYAGQEGKMFIQLLDSDNLPIDDSTCYVSIYYPNNQVFQYQQAMSYLDEGIYTYDFTTPYTDGVYPVSSFCTLPGLNITDKMISDTFDSGSVAGGMNWATNWNTSACYYDAVYVQSGTYSFACDGVSNTTRKFTGNYLDQSLNYDYYWRASSLEPGDVVYINIIDANGTTFNLFTITDAYDDGVFRRHTGTLYVEEDGIDLNGTLTFQINSDTSNSGDIINLDSLYIDLNYQTEVNYTEYQVIRGSGEVHMTSPRRYEDELVLGELTNESFQNSFIFHYDVVSLTSQDEEEQTIELEMWQPFPCHHVTKVRERYQNGSTANLSFSYFTNENDRCVISVFHDLGFEETYDIEIVSTNYWRDKLYKDYATVNLQKEMINISCQNYRLSNNLSGFESDDYGYLEMEDSMWASCGSYLDSYRHYDEDIQQYFSFDNQNINFTYSQILTLETEWEFTQQIKAEISDYANTIFNGLNLGNSYSLGLIADPYPPANPLYATYFGSISTSYLNYLAIQGIPGAINNTKIAEFVWSYDSRELTFIPTVNATIFDSVRPTLQIN